MARTGTQLRSSQSLILPGLLLLFVLPLLGYAGYSVADRWYQGYQLSREEAALRADILRLRERNLTLQAELKDAKSDWAIETIAREQLGLVKPGDRAIILVGPQPAAQAKPADVTTRRTESSEAASARQRPTEPAPRQPEPPARPPEPATQPAAPPEPGGWRIVLDALLGR